MTFQSNHGESIIDNIHNLYQNKPLGAFINPGAFTHYSYAFYDAVKFIEVSFIEVHIYRTL